MSERDVFSQREGFEDRRTQGAALAGVALAAAFMASSSAHSAVPGRSQVNPDQLSTIRERVMSLEGEIVDAARTQVQAKTALVRVGTLIRLQKEEMKLSHDRLEQLERTLDELENRRTGLQESIDSRRREARAWMKALYSSFSEVPRGRLLPSEEDLEAPRRKILSELVARAARDIETLGVDLDDADRLERQILDERSQLALMVGELEEREGVLELNRRLQADILKRTRVEHLAKLERYQRLKDSESRVEHLLKEFSSRRELERIEKAEREAYKSMSRSEFAGLRGRLSMPVFGKVVGGFGKGLDPETKLQVFHKGIEIEVAASSDVRAVHAGKIVFAGEMPGYGKIAIVDHGDHFYTLCGKLGSLRLAAGDAVSTGDVIGSSSTSGQPVYFEVRSRNIPVDPLQWVSASSSLNQ